MEEPTEMEQLTPISVLAPQYLEVMRCIDLIPLAKQNYQENLLGLACFKLKLFHVGDIIGICSNNPHRLSLQLTEDQFLDVDWPIDLMRHELKHQQQPWEPRASNLPQNMHHTQLPQVEVGNEETDLDPDAKLLYARLRECATLKDSYAKSSKQPLQLSDVENTVTHWTPLDEEECSTVICNLDGYLRCLVRAVDKLNGSTDVFRAWLAMALSETLHTLLRGVEPDHRFFDLLHANAYQSYERLGMRLDDICAEWKRERILKGLDRNHETNIEDNGEQGLDEMEEL